MLTKTIIFFLILTSSAFAQSKQNQILSIEHELGIHQIESVSTPTTLEMQITALIGYRKLQKLNYSENLTDILDTFKSALENTVLIESKEVVSRPHLFVNIHVAESEPIQIIIPKNWNKRGSNTISNTYQKMCILQAYLIASRKNHGMTLLDIEEQAIQVTAAIFYKSEGEMENSLCATFKQQ